VTEQCDLDGDAAAWRETPRRSGAAQIDEQGFQAARIGQAPRLSQEIGEDAAVGQRPSLGGQWRPGGVLGKQRFRLVSERRK
jgi:hypothetical protein